MEIPALGNRRFGWLEDLFIDARYAIRSLGQRANRGFAVVSILTLGLGIGAATSIFSVAYGFLENSFPFRNVDGIWQPWINFPPAATNNLTRVPRNFTEELKKVPAVSDVLESTFATGDRLLYVPGEFGPEVYQTYLMGPGAFAFLGVPPAMGRWINASDFGPNGAPADVVVLSHDAWQKFFPGDPNPVGKVVPFTDSRGAARPRTVIGVMPKRFGSQQIYEIGDTAWTPMPGPTFDAAAGTMVFRPRVRLKPGISKEVAEQQIATLYAELGAVAPPNTAFWLVDSTGGRTARKFNTTLRDFVSSTFDPQGIVRTNIRYLSIAVALLLLIACMNVANLQLARAAARSREIAVRLALGAGRGRLMRQLITESVVLALAGAALGILIAYGFTRGTTALLPPNTFGGAPLPSSAAIGLNGTVLLFSAVVAVVSGILFGLAPAIQSTRPDLNDALKDGSRGSAGAYGAKTRSVLVVAEVAFSIVLLVVASVTLWGYIKMIRIDPGFRPRGLYVVGPGLPGTDGRVVALIERVRALPFIESVARAQQVGGNSRYTLQGRPKDEAKTIMTGLVDEDFVHTAGITVIRGRNFTKDEVARGDRVALIGDAAAALWPSGVDPIGQQITVDSWAIQQPAAPGTPPVPGTPPTLTVIGVISNMRPNVSQDVLPSVFAPVTVRPGGGAFVVRVRPGEIPPLQREMQSLAASIDKTMRPGVQDLTAQFGTQFAMPRFNFVLFSVLAVIALVLAVSGIYSVLSYHIAQRTREFGVRLALGADPGSILRLVLGTGGKLIGAGLIVGLGGSVALGRVFASQSQIFRVNLSDPATFAVAVAAIGILSAAGAGACLVPARRATRVNPLVALRAE